MVLRAQVCGLKLLVCEAFSYECIRPSAALFFNFFLLCTATAACGLILDAQRTLSGKIQQRV